MAMAWSAFTRALMYAWCSSIARMTVVIPCFAATSRALQCADRNRVDQ